MTTRRNVMLGTLAAGASIALGTKLAAAQAAASFPKPSQPLTINVVDVAGDLQLSQPALDKFAQAHPDLVARMVYTQADAPELASKLKAQQAAGRVDMDLVLTGNDALAAGIAQNLWVEILPKYASMFPDLEQLYSPGAYEMQQMTQGQGFVDDWTPSGPLLEYAPDRVTNVPDSAESLMAWAKANPNKFMYARPANSGPGRTFVMGLPYVLGDKDPKDPINGWDKTWAYLKELGNYIEYYPSGTTATMKELGDGTRDIIATTCGWDINPRYLGIVPQEYKIATLKGFHWVGDANFMAIPKGVSDDRLGVLLQIIAYVLQPAQQAFMFDHAYMYPGPAIKNVALSTAPQDSQDTINQFGRPEYASLIANNPVEPPLGNTQLVAMFDKWDKDIGAAKHS
ncbi:MAG TPA: extracellular solute-binding protein [Devosiaceae bacterium]|nr:extracellular solute-binding protein [Devosiaceae bacterium]